VVHLPSELEGELALVAELNRSLIFKELEQAVMSQDVSPGSPLLGRLDTEIRVLREKLSELENGSPDSSFLHPLRTLPALTLEFFQLQKDLRIQQELQGLLIQQVEQAKLQESNDIPPLKILDSPRIPTLPVWPPKKIIVILATMAGFALSSLMALLVEFLELVRVNDGGQFSNWEWIPGSKR
jgi:capsule polysaccharide export protein KpsE/RkpR